MGLFSRLGDIFWRFTADEDADADAVGQSARGTILLDKKGRPMASLGGTEAHLLADGITLAANATSVPVPEIPPGDYIFDIQWGGAAAAIRLEALAADGVTWRGSAGTTVAAPGGAIGVRVGADATLRLKNTSATDPATDVYARIS